MTVKSINKMYKMCATHSGKIILTTLCCVTHYQLFAWYPPKYISCAISNLDLYRLRIYTNQKLEIKAKMNIPGKKCNF